MKRKWPFGFFVYGNPEETEDAVQAEPETAETAAENMTETVEEAAAEVAEEEKEADTFDDIEDEEDLSDLEEGLEIALEAAHQEEVKKQRLITGITVGIAALSVIGLATGFGIRAYLKKK